MKKFTILAALIPFVIQAQSFEEVETSIFDYGYSVANVADFNNDGFTDFVVCGDDANSDTKCDVYKNNNGVFELFQTLDNAVYLGDVSFVNLNNDGYYDILMTGQNRSDITAYLSYRYKFNGELFILEETSDFGKIFSSYDSGDFNNDGNIDVLLNGADNSVHGGEQNYIVNLFTNNDGVLTQSELVTGSQNGDVVFGDFNNDNLLDLAVFGISEEDQDDGGWGAPFRIYLNNGGNLELNQTLEGHLYGSVSMADFDGDGFLDMVATGVDAYEENTAFFLKNDGNGSFVKTELPKGLRSFGTEKLLDVGDLNNDGYYDVIIAGDDAEGNFSTTIYLFNPTTSEFDLLENEFGIPNFGLSGSLHLIDYNNDNHLDVLVTSFDENYDAKTTLFKNLSTEENQKPIAPTELNLNQEGNKLNFSWNGATDDKTPTEVLQYEIKVGTTSGAQDIAKYVVTTPSWFLELEEVPVNVYWTVKSIDASKVYSDASDEGQLSVSDNTLTNQIQIYPNPASDKVYVKADNLNSVELFDLQGRKIGVKLNSDNSINVSSLPKGVYVLKLNVNGKAISKKLVVN